MTVDGERVGGGHCVCAMRQGVAGALYLFLALTASWLVSGCTVAVPADTAQVPTTPLVVFLVRHAEKATGGRDPALSPAGVTRATHLAGMLRGAGLQYVHSSDYARTRATATPVAEAAGLTVTLYDPHDLPALARGLREKGGRHLIVGHSNTTPALVALLGGDPGAPIDDASEFDRLYIVTIDHAGGANTILLRYGSSTR